MIQIIEQTKEEKLAMYIKMSKRKLIDMLITCNSIYLKPNSSSIVKEYALSDRIKGLMTKNIQHEIEISKLNLANDKIHNDYQDLQTRHYKLAKDWENEVNKVEELKFELFEIKNRGFLRRIFNN